MEANELVGKAEILVLTSDQVLKDRIERVKLKSPIPVEVQYLFTGREGHDRVGGVGSNPKRNGALQLHGGEGPEKGAWNGSHGSESWLVEGALSPATSGSRVLVVVDHDAEGALELVDRLRQMDLSSKCIFITSRYNLDLEMRIRRVGVHFFLMKPVAEELLMRVIHKLLEHETSRFI